MGRVAGECFDVTFKANPSSLLHETHFGAAYLVALISAITGYACARKVIDQWVQPIASFLRPSACLITTTRRSLRVCVRAEGIVATMTVQGHLIPQATVDDLHVILMLNSEVRSMVETSGPNSADTWIRNYVVRTAD